MKFPTLSPEPHGFVEWALDLLFRREDIGNEFNGRGLLYMRRWRVLGYAAKLPKICGYNVMLHRMVRPDGDKDPHDHPWDFWSLVLWGGYIEELWDFEDWPRTPEDKPTLVRRRMGAFGRKTADQVHRVIGLPNRESWTLVLTNDRYRDWGFWSSNGWVFWKTYMGLVKK